MSSVCGDLRAPARSIHEATQAPAAPYSLEAFAQEAEKKPATLLYPRDPSLDPQLVWKGKDEQDSKDLAVPVVPIYIQEKIAPQAIIDDLLAERRRTAPEPQLDLFGDFNGLSFEQLIDFYKHDQHWSNRMILGDSLLVMGSLAEKEGLKGQVQTIYFDPPYGIKFGSNWQVSTRKRDVRDGRAEDATRQPEQIRAFRDTWEFGIHSYLAYLRDRLAIGRELLAESGSIFVQIGDHNIHLVRSLLDEVFGSENFVALIPFKKTSGVGSKLLDSLNDYLLWYARSIKSVKYRQLYRDTGIDTYAFPAIELADGTWKRMSESERLNYTGGSGRLFRAAALTSQSGGESSSFPVEFDGTAYLPSKNTHWKTNRQGMDKLRDARRLLPIGNTLTYKRYQDDFPVRALTNWWDDTVQSTFATENIFVVQTYTRVVERCVLMTTDPGDLVLDPTCGSGTTAYVGEQWGRRWITIDTSRVALALARTRLMSARFPYYVLRDSPVGVAKEAEVSGQTPASMSQTVNDVRQGFVYERVPHVTLKSIANNPDVREGMTPEELNAAISSHGEREVLFDRPYVDSKVVRVTGPFTLESLSPHRLIDTEIRATTDADSNDFVGWILEHLRKFGVQNTVKNERLTFDRLDLWPGGAYVQAAGEYTEVGKSRPIAVAIGPEYGTVGGEFVREAAKEAIRIADLLVVCGFAFEAHVEDTSNLGKLTILRAKMNPDLAMGEDLLKKTGAGNLFTVFGEPDIQIKKEPDQKFSVEIRGIDVYDPTTGVVRSHSTDDIATWFIDTNYNGESFFVRHAYFLGADDPYDKLKRALRAEIDEAAWSSLYSTKSRPFPKPETGKIAVKVINHYGDEVLKVYPVA